jgi:hypothetical protein
MFRVFGRRKDGGAEADAGAANPKEVKARIAKLRKAAAGGDAQAQFDLGCALQLGIPGHLPADADGAVALFEQAGNQVRSTSASSRNHHEGACGARRALCALRERSWGHSTSAAAAFHRAGGTLHPAGTC